VRSFHRKFAAATSALWLAAAAPAFAHEIYWNDMQDAYTRSQTTFAPCDDSCYDLNPAKCKKGDCNKCQGSILLAREKVQIYDDLVAGTHQAEHTAEAGTQQSADYVAGAGGTQNVSTGKGATTQNQGATGEYQKASYARQLKDAAQACMDLISCKGKLASEDDDAGKREYKACEDLADGARKAENDKMAKGNEMKRLETKGSSNTSNLGQNQGLSGESSIASGVESGGATLQVSAATESIAAAAAAAGAAAAGGLSGGGDKSRGTAGGRFGGGSGGEVRTDFQDGRNTQEYTYDELAGRQPASLKKDAILTAGGGGAKASGSNASDEARESSSALYEQGSETAKRKRKKLEAEAMNSGIKSFVESQAGNAYTDPLLSFLSNNTESHLVDRLRGSAALREKLRKRLEEIERGDGVPGGGGPELVAFYRRALAEAEEGLDEHATLNELAPMEAQEAFGMDSDETAREIGRLTASLGSKGSTDSTYSISLFPRVSQAISRQLAKGKLDRKRK